jgi:hypothetical protein
MGSVNTHNGVYQLQVHDSIHNTLRYVLDNIREAADSLHETPGVA